MFGFLFKILIIAAVVVGIGGYIGLKKGINIPGIPKNIASQAAQLKLPAFSGVSANIKSINAGVLGQRLSETLDALVTHPGRNPGPVVLGVKVTNDSLGVITDALMKLPNDQLQQVQQALCASPSAK